MTKEEANEQKIKAVERAQEIKQSLACLEHKLWGMRKDVQAASGQLGSLEPFQWTGSEWQAAGEQLSDYPSHAEVVSVLDRIKSLREDREDLRKCLSGMGLLGLMD